MKYYSLWSTSNHLPSSNLASPFLNQSGIDWCTFCSTDLQFFKSLPFLSKTNTDVLPTETCFNFCFWGEGMWYQQSPKGHKSWVKHWKNRIKQGNVCSWNTLLCRKAVNDITLHIFLTDGFLQMNASEQQINCCNYCIICMHCFAQRERPLGNRLDFFRHGSGVEQRIKYKFLPAGLFGDTEPR